MYQGWCLAGAEITDPLGQQVRASRRQEPDRPAVVAGFLRPSHQRTGSVVVKIVDFQPAKGGRELPTKSVNEHTLPVMMHLHQRDGVVEAVFGED